MIRSLRKGGTSFELWHKYGSDSIHAIQTEIELKPDHAVFRTVLKPIDENQRMDADSIFDSYLDSLYKITCWDAQIFKYLERFIRVYDDRIDYFLLDLIYKRHFEYKVDLYGKSPNEVLIELET